MFKTLSQEDKDFVKEVYYMNISHEEKIDLLKTRFPYTDRTFRRWWFEELSLQKPSEEYTRDIAEDTDILLVTAAQNNTPVHSRALKNILAYKHKLESKGLKVELVVIPMTYMREENIMWDHEVYPYLYKGKLHFNGVLVDANTTINLTAVSPLSGRELTASKEHLIIPHSRVHFEVLPRLKGMPLRTMCTTGMITHRRYTASNAGDKAFYHHVIGFVVVERKRNGCFVPRNVKCDSNGDFVDLNTKVYNGEVSKANILGVVLGDSHVANLDPLKHSHTKAIIEKLNPAKLYFHDVLDGEAFNPHDKADMYIRKQRIRENKHLVGKEVQEALDFIRDVSGWYKGQIRVVQSNHHKFLDRYINGDDWKKDLINSEAYLRYALIQQTVNLQEHGTIFGYLVNHLGNNIKYVKTSDAEKLGNFIVMHGHVGVNGAKPSPVMFKRLNTKLLLAHTHSPKILDGVTVAGTSSKLWMYYNVDGFSTWAHGDVVVSEFGKAQLFVYDDDYAVSRLL
jgi:hypothetical protein